MSAIVDKGRLPMNVYRGQLIIPVKVLAPNAATASNLADSVARQIGVSTGKVRNDATRQKHSNIEVKACRTNIGGNSNVVNLFPDPEV